MTNINEFKFLQKSINTLISEEGFENNCKVIVRSGTKKGEGFLGDIYFVTIQDSKKTLEIVAKSALKNDEVREKFHIQDVYRNEIYFYSTVYPALKKFEKDFGIVHCFNGTAKFYNYSEQNGAETLCFENLVTDGFEVMDKKLLFDEDYFKLVFDKYAHLHALSFAFKDKKPDEYNKIVSKMDNIWSKMGIDIFLDSISSAFNDVSNHFKKLGNDKMASILDKYAKNTKQIYFDAVNSSNKYSAIIHGDCWSNNMMFKYEKNGKKRTPIDMRLLDFQLAGCSSLASDLTYMFYSSGSKKEFDKKDEYLKYYYEKFSNYLKQFGSDANKLYPYESLIGDFKRYTKLGLSLALVLNKIKLNESEDIKDLTDIIQQKCDFVPSDFKNEMFYERAENLVLHLHEINSL